MQKIKKIFLGLFLVISMISPLVAIIHVGSSSVSRPKHTLGLAIEPISSLNYIKYTSSVKAASPLIEGIAKAGPEKNSAIGNYLNLKKFYINSISATDYGYQTGTLRRSLDRNDFIKAISYVGDYERADKFTFNLNGKSKWGNGDLLKSSDFIDSLVYVLDLNTGSQRIKEIYDLNIKGAREFVNAQNEYAKIFGVTYKNPFGYVYQKLPKNASERVKKVWTYWKQDLNKGFSLQNQSHSQSAQEQKYVDDIRKAASGIGIYGDKYSSHPHPNQEKLGWELSKAEIDDYKIKFNKDYIQPFKLDIRTEFKMEVFTFTINGIIMNSKNLIPVNRNFIESNGGIEEFGKNRHLFLTQGPFKIKEATFGINGNMVLQKDDSYWASNEIIPESIKLFFQTDPIVLGSLFEDGYISSTKINATYTKKFYADTKLRNLIKKTIGVGTTGFIINLDEEKNTNKALMDPIFRKALLLAIDREEIIKVSGFDTTIPSYSLLEPSSWLKSYIAPDGGSSVGNNFNHERIFYTNSYSAPIISASSTETIGLNQLFANPNQKDRLRNIRVARKFMNQYRKDNNIAGPITITFLNDSTAFMKNMSIALKSQIKHVFGTQIKLEIKGLPKSLYDSYVVSGNFELTWKNIDYLNSNNFVSGIDAFMTPDGIETKNMKSTGFVENPSGSWTIANAFKYYKDKKIEQKTRQRLRIKPKIWNKIKELVTYQSIPGLTKPRMHSLMKRRINSFFQRTHISIDDLPPILKTNKKWNSVDKDFDTNHELYKFILACNKIIMDQAAFIPLFRVDVTVKIDRLPSVNFSQAQVGYGYLYDLSRKPRPDLPGLEVKGL